MSYRRSENAMIVRHISNKSAMTTRESRFPKLDLTRRVQQINKTCLSPSSVLINNEYEWDCLPSTKGTSRASFGCDDETISSRKQCLSRVYYSDDNFESQQRQNVYGVVIRKKKKCSEKSTQTCFVYCNTDFGRDFSCTYCYFSDYFQDVSSFKVSNKYKKLSSITEIDLAPGGNVGERGHDSIVYQEEYFEMFKSMKDMVQQLQTKVVVVEKQLALVNNRDNYKNEIDEYISGYLWGEVADYALESSGGSVVDTPETTTYNGAHDPITVTLFGLPVWDLYTSHVRLIIKGPMQPGQCWAFSGAEGRVVIRLALPVQVSAVTIEHFPEQLLPVKDGVLSAPRQFTVMGFTNYEDVSEEDRTKINIGSFEYKRGGDWRQTFPVHRKVFQDMKPVQFVEFHFQSNHGNPTYTCVYRVRVHG